MERMRSKNKYIGDLHFYKMVVTIALPLIVQQIVTSFVNMLDNIMVGQTGTFAMSGVSVANQMLVIFNIAVFGLISAAGIFGAQFAGKGDMKNIRNCLYYKFIFGSILSLIAMAIVFFFGQDLLSLYMNGKTDTAENIAKTTGYALDYMRIMTLGFIPFAFSQAISSAIRENGETGLPMMASLATVFVNFVFNWLLIFGHFGFPKLGPNGAAIATVISRFAELSFNIYIAIRNRRRFPFFTGLIKEFKIPRGLFKDITIRGVPLMANEILYSIGLAAIAQSYSTRGIEALAAFNISSTIINLFYVFNIAMGDSISIMVGQRLGAGKIEEAVDVNRKLIVFTVFFALLIGLVLYVLAPIFPRWYNTSPEVRATAVKLLRTGGLLIWISSAYCACYFTLRCGGKTVVTFLFDSVGTMLVSFPVSYILSRYTSWDIVHLYMSVQLFDLYKVILGLTLVSKRVWVKNLVG